MQTIKEAFEKLGYSIKERKQKEPKVFKCKKCGSDMVICKDTNVATCTGIDEKGVKCDNYIIFRKRKAR